ncbi:hypothetical protein BDQ12DRAFT_680199 [Crucibulum laeve]|uniref:Amino acid transporter transmembrane domain-containing protein n=1 Tax=Crucibulum laeve TaxID=68775 RepID=A0A5C3MI74_9AGAR|nr:hypothetical protein BDQ12DRAFT_680199 [Crucibulum laeve]
MADSRTPWSVAASSRRPPSLIMPGERNSTSSHRRHLSIATTSSATSADYDSAPEDSPVADSALDSSAALILVHDPHDDDDGNIRFDFSDDDADSDDSFSPQFEIRKASIPPLSPTLVFLYLLTPFLKLGALFLPYTESPLKYGLSELLVFAILAALARQIWYMLARYIRKADMEEMVCDTFARRRGKERQRELLRTLVRAGTGSISVLLATTYLRESTQTLLPLLPDSLFSPFSAPALTLVLSFLVLLFSSSKSLASKRVVYATWLSLITYLAWLGCLSFAHSRGALEVHSGWLSLGTFWQGITTTAFSFTSSSTLPLYASLKGTTHPITTTKTPRSRSFRLLSLLSILTATLLMLPSVLFAAFPNRSETSSHSLVQDHPLQDTPLLWTRIALGSLSAATLLLGIPAILVTTPALPIPERIRRTARFSVSKSLTFLLVVLVALVPAQVSSVMSDILLVLTLTSTYFLPALIHISTHFFKRPIAIVIPTIPGTPSLGHTPSNSHSAVNTPTLSPRSLHDELLQRKERALQKKQSRKRIVWNIGVWLLMGVSVTGIVGAGGRLVGRW